MYFLYLIIVFIGTFVCLFFLIRTIITMLSSFGKSPFVPLRRVLREKSLKILEVKKGDRFLDIGSGDGRVVFECAKRYPQARFYEGIEIISVLVAYAQIRKFFTKKNSKIFFTKANALNYSYKDYNKIYMYLLPEFVEELMKKLETELPSKAVVVSALFAIPDSYSKKGKLSIEEVQLGRKIKKIYVWKKN